jgi:hypothetical protein
VKKAHEHWSTQRFANAVAPLTREYVARYGLTVRHGPFEGLRYLEDAATIAKLVGAYEQQLHDVIEEWIVAAFDSVIDVGSAEGYYAVGLALRLPTARVHAFDTDEHARELCTRMADLNGVGNRVRVGTNCSLDLLREIPDATRVALLLDCEGCELDLLRPDLVAALKRWPILVELHEFLNPDTATILTGRFGETHTVNFIPEQRSDSFSVPELEDFRPPQRRLALDERRPAPMRWAYFRPRSTGS